MAVLFLQIEPITIGGCKSYCVYTRTYMFTDRHKETDTRCPHSGLKCTRAFCACQRGTALEDLGNLRHSGGDAEQGGEKGEGRYNVDMVSQDTDHTGFFVFFCF